MAKDDSFIFYRSFHNQLKELDDESRLRIYDTIVEYMFEHIIPEFKGMENAFWLGIKDILDRDKARYDDMVQKRSEAGKKHKGNQYTLQSGTNGTSVPKTEQVSQKWNKCPKNGTNGTDNVNVNVNVNDNVNVNVSSNDDEEKEKEISLSSSNNNLDDFQKECIFLIHRDKQVIECFCKSQGLTCINSYRAWCAVFCEFCKGEQRAHKEETDLINHFHKWFHKLGAQKPKDKVARYEYFLGYYAKLYPEDSKVIANVVDSSKSSREMEEELRLQKSERHIN